MWRRIALAVLAATAVRAQEPAPAEDCAAIVEDAARLACYDRASGRSGSPAPTPLEALWDLPDEAKPFRPWAHRPTYVLAARYSTDPNEGPFVDSENPEAEPVILDVQPVEVKFQISFKTKIVDDLIGGAGDIWFGYTQQSHFQAYNSSESRPFRETNFEPEGILAFPIRRAWGSWTWRVLGVGIVHQSNGRSEPLSRGWNRIYAMAAGEKGNVSLHVRPWIRLESDGGVSDDNPGIADHIGRMEAVVLWQPRRHVVSFRGRSNLDVGDHHGSLQVDWFFPLGARVRGQLQAFSGYGESLIDYDHRQTTIGLGVLLFDPF